MVKSGRSESLDRKEPKHQIRIMLQEGKKGWADLSKGTKCSPSTLSKILKELMKQGEVKAETDQNDRRITWYTSVKEKVDPQIRRYKAIQFLENMKRPFSKEKEDNGVTMSVFFDDPKPEDNVKEMVKGTFDAFDIVASAIGSLTKLSSVNKFALIVTVEKKINSS